MSDNHEYVERTTVRETPVVVRSSNAGWWIAAIVAIIAVAGLLFIYTGESRDSDLQAARDQGAAQATLDAATTTAQRAAVQASSAAQTAVDSSAHATQHAAEAAQVAASQTAQAAQNAGDAARDASVQEAPAQPQ